MSMQWKKRIKVDSDPLRLDIESLKSLENKIGYQNKLQDRLVGNIDVNIKLMYANIIESYLERCSYASNKVQQFFEGVKPVLDKKYKPKIQVDRDSLYLIEHGYKNLFSQVSELISFGTGLRDYIIKESSLEAELKIKLIEFTDKALLVTNKSKKLLEKVM